MILRDNCMEYIPGTLTNKEAAAYLRTMLNSNIIQVRGNGKSSALRFRLEVLMKAIEALEKMPDE